MNRRPSIRAGRVILILAGLVCALTAHGDPARAAEAQLIARSDGRFDRPHDIHLLRDGNLMVVDSGNNRLVTLDKNLKVISVPGGAPWNFNDLKYVVDDDRGRLYVADEHNNRVAIIDPVRRAVLFAIAEFSTSTGAERLNQPEGVAVRGDTLWVLDTYNDWILAFQLRW